MGEAAIVESDGVVRVEPDCLAVVGEGALKIALGSVRATSIEIGQRVFRLQPDRLAVVGNGAVEIALGAVDPSADEVGKGVVGVEPERLGGVGHGAVVFPIVMIDMAAAKVTRGILGSQPDGLIAIAQSLAEVSLSAQRAAPMAQGVRGITRAFDTVENERAGGNVAVGTDACSRAFVPSPLGARSRRGAREQKRGNAGHKRRSR